MKQRIYITGALILLLALTAYMAWDLFLSKENPTNPYDLGMDSIRHADTSDAAYRETDPYIPVIREITGIATDRQGRLYLCGTDSIDIPGENDNNRNIIKTGETSLCIHVDGQGQIFLGMIDHIELRDKNGKLLSNWNSPAEGTIITSISTFGQDVFAADAGNKVVYRYNYQGKLIGKIGQKDPEAGIPGFVIPSPYFDLAVAKDGNLWVVNPGMHEFEKFTPDGVLLEKWNKASMDVTGFCGCCNPSHFAFLTDSLIVTSEKGIERVKVYDLSGNFKALVALPASFTEGTRGLDLATGPEGEIYVLDPLRRMVRKFISK